MSIQPLNSHGLLYDGVKFATLDTPTLINAKVKTAKSGDRSEHVANTEFVSSMMDVLEDKLAQVNKELNAIKAILAEGGFGGSLELDAYIYKGSCTYANLPKNGNSVGDVWNVTDWHDNVPAGTNYAWTGTEWDALGGKIEEMSDKEITDVINKVF